MLEVRDLTKHFGSTTAVEGLNLSLGPGEIIGLLGPNGSGKSTTVQMLVGLLEPTRGEIRLNQVSLRREPERYKRQIGYVPEIPHIYPYLSGREYLEMVGDLRRVPPRTAALRNRALLEHLGLGGDAVASMATYSKGMRQKVLIAAALLADPPLLVFDEPMSGLDVGAALVFRSLVQGLVASGKAIVYCSHALESVEKLCTRAVILRKGQVAAQDSVAHLRSLLRLPSLEDVFAQLTAQQDPETTAARVLAAMGTVA